tara:strand:- start:10201 stop:10866 length:666 start_codon:yes stop_codon:yes gene_type:complete
MSMLINTSEFSIPTRIHFTLFRYDHTDSILISRVKSTCHNYSRDKDSDHFIVRASHLKNAIETSSRLSHIAKSGEGGDFKSLKLNSVIFIWKILNSMSNLRLVSFNVSKDKNYTRLFKHEGKDVFGFNFKIQEGFMDLPRVLSRKNLDRFNMKLIEMGLMKNSFLSRSPFFQMDASLFFEALALAQMDHDDPELALVLESIDPQLEEDNPVLLVKTDYSAY